jgi:flagellar biosynthesis/type III secretory pathway protein FliH
MSQALTIHFDKPVVSAKVVDGDSNGVGSRLSGRAEGHAEANTEQIMGQDLEAQKAGFSQACQTLNGVVAKLNEFYDKVYAEHREEIARLSVEIARKILMQKVDDGDYEMESIIKEALKNAPSRQDLVVHLNPEDLAKCQKAQQDEPSGALAGIKFVSDQSIGRAECVLESPKGVIKSLIDENLERIGKALKKAE